MFIRLIYRRAIARIYVVFLVAMAFFIFSKSPWRKKDELHAEKFAPLVESSADINTRDVYSAFNFDASWAKNKGFWSHDFDARVETIKANKTSRLPLKVLVLPHSHNDPGWLLTFQEYFDRYTSKIITNVVSTLTKHKDMKFIWAEISFLDLWWESATAEQRDNFKKLVSEGRLEIMTGGWVMTDEANVHLYAMLDQLIEGHQWVKATLNVTPKTGWSIDPFGQGSTVPHLLAKSGFDGAIIQRIHYNWKEYFARHQQGEFLWKSHWMTERSSEYTLLTHNMPFDLYSIKHACGPDMAVCSLLNFCHVPGIYNEQKDVITESNVERYANLMIDQYRKTASLFSHNVALVLLGDDFSYWHELELDQQYENYKKLFDYINEHSSEKFDGATIEFGTPSDYFRAVRKRQRKFPTLVGDFFPYADVYVSGEPAHWTGFYTTRPFYKLLSRELEHHLRSAEILFTIGLNRARQLEAKQTELKILEKSYERLIGARRSLGVFQHHDAITGTSKSHVMRDYRAMLEHSITAASDVQRHVLEMLSSGKERNFLESESERKQEESLWVKKVIKVDGVRKILLFNSLPHDRYEVISLHVASKHVRVFDADGNAIKFQINSIFREGEISPDFSELLFLAFLPALSTKVIELRDDSENPNKQEFLAKILTGDLNDVTIENSRFKLTFDALSGFLSSAYDKRLKEDMILSVSFGAYQSIPRESGAYLFKPQSEYEHFAEDPSREIFVVKGEIASEVTVRYGSLLTHTLRIFNTDTYLDDALSIDNVIDFGNAIDREMVMRVKGPITNENKVEEAEFFTDLNSFQWEPRRASSKLDLEGNYYPITSSIFIQDETQRLSLLTTHAQGATSVSMGEIEVMLERKMNSDDSRGMGEGIFDNVKTEQKFWVLIENFQMLGEKRPKQQYHTPSLFAHHLSSALNNPAHVFVIARGEKIKLHENSFFNTKLPCDVNLVNLRTLSNSELEWLPSENALFILHRLGYEGFLDDGNFRKQICSGDDIFKNLQFINRVRTKGVKKSSLTGLKTGRAIKSFRHDPLEPMEIRSYQISFE